MGIKSLKTPVKLDYPVEYGGETVAELSMRRPITNDEIRKAQRKKSGMTDQECQTQMFADMCGVDYELMCMTDLTDQASLVEAYEGFFPKPVTDGTESPLPVN